MISLHGIDKYFNKGLPNQVHALGPLDLEIVDKEFLVIVGANGSGKSTLLNLVAGASFPTGGGIMLNGKRVERLPEYKRSRWIARVFQNPLSGTAPELSILDNFRLAAIRTRSKTLKIGVGNKFRKKVADHISMLGMGLEQKLDQPMGTLSGGQRQALTLLMSVMDEAKLLLLDEPTAALDPRSARLVMETADRLIKTYGLTAILVTHNIKDASEYGSRLIQMREGQIIKDIPSTGKQMLGLNDIYSWFA